MLLEMNIAMKDGAMVAMISRIDANAEGQSMRILEMKNIAVTTGFMKNATNAARGFD